MTLSDILNVALIADDRMASAGILAALREAKYFCTFIKRTPRAIAALRPDSFTFILVLQDKELPVIPSSVADIRQRVGDSMPIILLCDTKDNQRLVALRSGANTCLELGTSNEIIIAQIEALSHRFFASDMSVGHLAFDKLNERALVEGTPVFLTTIEYALAVLLCRNLNKLISREELLKSVWGRTEETRSLDVHASRIRTKLKLTSDRGFRLSSVYKRGYKMNYFPSET